MPNLTRHNKARRGSIRGHDNRASEREFFPTLALPCFSLPSFLPSFPLPFPFPFPFFLFLFLHPLLLPSITFFLFPPPSPLPHIPPHVPPCMPLYLPRSGSTSPSTTNRTAGQCATHSEHVQPTCPTRPCSSSNYHTGTEGAVHRTRNSGIYHHSHWRAIRECPELFVPPLSCPYFIVINPSRFPHSLSAFIYPRQGLWGWLLWYGLALRLAWGATPQ